MVQWLRLWALNTEGPGSILGQGTISCMLQLKIPCATTYATTKDKDLTKGVKNTQKNYKRKVTMPRITMMV